MKKLKFILDYAKPDDKRIIAIFFDVAIYALAMLVSPLILSIMVDNVIQGIPADNQMITAILQRLGGDAHLRNNLWIGSLLMLAVYILIAFGVHRRTINCGLVSETFAENIRNAVYDHMQKLPFAYHKQKDSGDLLQRCTSDIDQIRRFLASQISEMLYSILIVCFAAAILFSKHAKLAAISVVLLPLILIASLIFYTKSKKIFLDCDIAESKMMAVLQENLNAMRVVKAFHQEKVEIDKFEEKNEDYRVKLFRLVNALGIFWNISDLIGMIQILIMIIFGIQFAVAQQLSVGTFFVFLTYISMIIWPIRQLGRILADMGKVSVSVSRIKEILDEEAEDLEAGIKPEIIGDIVFDHVSFNYEDSEEHTLNDVSFHIEANTRVAIMGPTGSGKSSLIHLLNGIYDYKGGSIRIDGHELRTISKAWLRKKVQIVLQEPFLYSKTIYENIHLAASKSERDEIIKAAKTASIHNVIEEFEKGYDTEVGEKGVTLSGGQKQRLAIARSLLLKSPIVIFDDSLSALDSKTDAMIQDALNQLDYPVTTLMITHRINTARNADLILVLDHGKLIQSGTHESLIHEEGLYKRIYEIQSEGGESHGE